MAMGTAYVPPLIQGLSMPETKGGQGRGLQRAAASGLEGAGLNSPLSEQLVQNVNRD